MLGGETPEGILNVTVVQADGLRRADLVGDNDVYVKMSVNVPVQEAVEQTKKQQEDPKKVPLYQMTQICSSKRPIWNESFAMPVFARPCTLFLEVYDSDYNKDDFLGKTELVLDSDQEIVQDTWLDLDAQGKVHVLVHYMPKSFLDGINFKFNSKASELKERMTKKLVNSLADFAAHKIKGSF